MTLETETIVRGIAAMDPDVTREHLERAIEILRETPRDPDALLKVVPFDEAARRLGCSDAYVRNLVRQGRLRGVRGAGSHNWGVSAESLGRLTRLSIVSGRPDRHIPERLRRILADEDAAEAERNAPDPKRNPLLRFHGKSAAFSALFEENAKRGVLLEFAERFAKDEPGAILLGLVEQLQIVLERIGRLRERLPNLLMDAGVAKDVRDRSAEIIQFETVRRLRRQDPECDLLAICLAVMVEHPEDGFASAEALLQYCLERGVS